jgi:UDP-2,3-diacylglucosamine hydrolase
MPPNTAIVVADAHLGSRGSDPESSAFQRFLVEVPKLGRHLVINGDLFEFWFEYRSVIPRGVFPILAELWNVVRSGVRVTLTGGNHDRWGGPFWEEQMGAEYHRHSVELDLAGWRTLLAHGDGDTETEFLSKAVHRIIGHPLTAMSFRALHPDLGFWLVRKSSRVLSRRKDDDAGRQNAADAQASAARALLERRDDLDLVVLGHTHRATIEDVGPNRWYLNPGAWMDGYEYAVVTENGPELRRFDR